MWKHFVILRKLRSRENNWMVHSESKMNNSSSKDKEAGGSFTYIIAFAVGLMFLLVTIGFACVRLRMRMGRGPNMLNGNSTSEEDPLEHIDTSFEGSRKLLYSELELDNKGSSSSSCSICLGDYKESDMLRLLPHCNHLFHLSCVDPWLRLHSTCPICRKSSIQPSHALP
ncbi:hypothetical protein VNO78_19964 [Psophocarpus tetragonolobus]|uniref:RING-type domain-containing protein n=1 Tax=Psophocarpus tetragonolobus TaxID=3891 RepID=A0AAN9SCI0_PSOTE